MCVLDVQHEVRRGMAMDTPSFHELQVWGVKLEKEDRSYLALREKSCWI